jgi:beta-lactamase class C
LGLFALAVSAFALAKPFGNSPDPGSAAAAQARELAQTSARLSLVEPASRSRIDYAKLDARLRRMVQQPTMVGMAVGVVENGRITFLSGYGETIEGSNEKVTPATVFRWASVSKGVASTMVAKLAEEGKLGLEQPVATLAPSLRLPGRNEQVATVADVLSHRLGLYRNAFDNKLEEGQDVTALRSSLATLNSVCRPGTCWSYQNVAYDAASEIVMRASGVRYQDEVKRELFAPLGMTSASLTRDGLVNARSWARPHSVGRRPMEVNDIYYRVPAAGGVNSNIKDMALWMLAQMGEMPQVLSPRLLETIHAPRVATPNERGRLRKFLERLKDPQYAYGWRTYDYAGHHIVGHRGGVNGYRSLILFDPRMKSGVVALWNSNTFQPGGLEFEVMDMLYGLEFRDWMEIDKGKRPVVAATEEEENSGEPGRRG